MKYFIVAGLILGVLSAVASESQPNILFIVSDDHGWGDLPSNWDKTELQMPVLDGLAAEGARFSNYHTVPLCGPSRACMFTGQFTSENGMWRGPGKGPVPGDPGYRGIKRDVKMLSNEAVPERMMIFACSPLKG
jgi:arylsulfatase A-like enzyme